MVCETNSREDVRNVVVGMPELELIETGMHLEEILPKMASANAYLGVDAILAALHTGAEVIITGRVSDPSLFLALNSLSSKLVLQ